MDMPKADADVPSDDLYIVRGWLVQTMSASCPAPVDYGPDTNTEWWCGGSFLVSAQQSPEQIYGTFDLGGLHVQWGAYSEYATNPSWNGRGSEPREGNYLVRSVGCEPMVSGSCPVWRMLGRLDTP
jgi:hypothetical protein